MNLIPPLIDSVQACQAHRLTDSVDGGFVKASGQNVVLEISKSVFFPI